MKKIYIIVALVVIVAIGLYIKNRSEENSNNSQQNTFTAKVERKNIVSSISTSGQIASANYLSVTTSVNGIVNKVYVKEGDKVTTGQKLMDVTLDSEGEKSRISAYSAYLKAKNSLASAKDNLIVLEAAKAQKNKDFQDEKERNSYQSSEERLAFQLAESEFKNAESNIENAQAQIKELELAVSNTWLNYTTQAPTITAPSSGVIASVLAVEGSKIENSITSDRSVQTVAAIKKDGTPIATLNIGETEINKVQVGQKVLMSVTSIEDKLVEGTIAGIDRIGSVSGGVVNYTVAVKFTDQNEYVLPNMSVQANIIVSEKENALTIPSAAVISRKGKTFVRSNSETGIREIEIETGLVGNNDTEVISGINENAEVIIDALPVTGFSTSTQTQFRGGFGVGEFNRR